MQQRVAIARALMGRPEVLLMDEPFGALDAQTREVMHDLILHVFDLERATIVFVTHDVEEAIYLGQRVVLMAPRPGRIDSIYQVPLPAEREQDMKHTPEFLRLKQQILARIRETSGHEDRPRAAAAPQPWGRRSQAYCLTAEVRRRGGARRKATAEPAGGAGPTCLTR